ncbi:hypothetical protein BFJ66_g3421 [Fusarium oxysporum f. sp. cepae]|uniref:Uncharacterized protein n=1 Tax=Fusarium oxysporum f. sp. cepae TaxID=396571 RepID=A0A3L6P8F5_FUSOX|nr:hypothetical protein BFJ65_g2042 [Fusarium oxysporum f. sp. cepae]RKK56870.1 hypothetical protein BFJ66_g3421 [Fusarium oxysporum f. sp. cepae]RKK63482.1 hypothetical protein BFJ67_g774 [Fusarium oxysporum f. sp. cepae]
MVMVVGDALDKYVSIASTFPGQSTQTTSGLAWWTWTT